MRKLEVMSFVFVWVLGYVGSANAEYFWTKYGNAPVLDVGSADSWDDRSVSSPYVMKDGDLYKMWYEGNSIRGIGYATSTDGVHWDKYGSPVLAVGGTYSQLGSPSVINENGSYKMWFVAGTGQRGIGYATSNNGVNWTMEGSLLPITWEVGAGMSDPFVVKDNGTYKMWYAGHANNNWAIGYATSVNGIDWDKYGGPVLNLDSSGTELFEPWVIIEDGFYTMWYGSFHGQSYRLGYATSIDGVNWTDQGDSVLGLGIWDSNILNCPSVMKDGNTYEMWYAGSASILSYDELRIGYATAAPVPIPGTVSLLFSGLVGLAGLRKISGFVNRHLRIWNS